MKNVSEFLAPNEREREFIEKREVQRVDVFNTSANVNLDLQSEEAGYEIKGLVVNLSSRGCCIIFQSDSIPDVFSFVRVSIGQQTNVPAQIRWMRHVERGVFKMGLCYQL